MKHLMITVLIVLFTANAVFAAPNYDPNKKWTTYDNSYNIALRNRLEDEYHKKYTVKIDDTHYLDTSPIGAYGREVLKPFYEQQINPHPNR